jgi:hypothetical protein
MPSDAPVAASAGKNLRVISEFPQPRVEGAAMDQPDFVKDDDLTLVDRPQDELLSAACSISGYEASRKLNIRMKGGFNDVPGRNYFRRLFTFSRAELLHYIESNPGLAQRLLMQSYDNRGTPSAYMEEVPGGYSVGWFDNERSLVRFHRRIEDAATDFVRLWWGLNRD